MKKYILGIAFIILFGITISWFVASQLIAPALRSVDSGGTNLTFQNIKIESNSGSTLAAWHIRSDKPQGVIVLLHGIRENRESMLNRAELLYAEGYSLVLIDFQSHGESYGRHITMGRLEKHDVTAAIRYARKQHPGEAIGLIGVSLGGASAVFASPLDIDALVIESVYSNLPTAVKNRVTQQLGALSWLPVEILLALFKFHLGFSASELSPVEMIMNVDCPVFIISGKKDLRTTLEETNILFSLAKEPKQLWLVDDTAHVDIINAKPDKYRELIVDFFGRYLKSN